MIRKHLIMKTWIFLMAIIWTRTYSAAYCYHYRLFYCCFHTTYILVGALGQSTRWFRTLDIIFITTIAYESSLTLPVFKKPAELVNRQFCFIWELIICTMKIKSGALSVEWKSWKKALSRYFWGRPSICEYINCGIIVDSRLRE